MPATTTRVLPEGTRVRMVSVPGATHYNGGSATVLGHWRQNAPDLHVYRVSPDGDPDNELIGVVVEPLGFQPGDRVRITNSRGLDDHRSPGSGQWRGRVFEVIRHDDNRGLIGASDLYLRAAGNRPDGSDVDFFWRSEDVALHRPAAAPEPEPAQTPRERVNVGDTVRVLHADYNDQYVGQVGVVLQTDAAWYGHTYTRESRHDYYVRMVEAGVSLFARDVELVTRYDPNDPDRPLLMGDRVAIAGAARHTCTRWIGLTGRLSGTDTHSNGQVRVTLDPGQRRPDQSQYGRTIYWPISLLERTERPAPTSPTNGFQVGDRVRTVTVPDDVDLEGAVGTIEAIRPDEEYAFEVYTRRYGTVFAVTVEHR